MPFSCRLAPETAKVPRLAMICWFLALTIGQSVMLTYGWQRDVPQRAGPPVLWPEGSRLARNQSGDSLLLFVHPRCPCTQATTGELERLLSSFQTTGRLDRLELWVVAAIPRGATKEWTSTSLIERSSRLPKAKLCLDYGGIEALRFAALASGTVMLYSADGRLRYSGGVTAARGHAGANAGIATLARLLTGESGSMCALPALGCRLVLEDPNPRGEIARLADARSCGNAGKCPPTNSIASPAESHDP
jgi:hypothetical protein